MIREITILRLSDSAISRSFRGHFCGLHVLVLHHGPDGAGEREEDGDVLEVGVLALEDPHPREERVLGGGAGRTAPQNRPVFLLNHAKLALVSAPSGLGKKITPLLFFLVPSTVRQ